MLVKADLTDEDADADLPDEEEDLVDEDPVPETREDLDVAGVADPELPEVRVTAVDRVLDAVVEANTPVLKIIEVLEEVVMTDGQIPAVLQHGRVTYGS